MEDAIVALLAFTPREGDAVHGDVDALAERLDRGQREREIHLGVRVAHRSRLCRACQDDDPTALALPLEAGVDGLRAEVYGVGAVDHDHAGLAAVLGLEVCARPQDDAPIRARHLQAVLLQEGLEAVFGGEPHPREDLGDGREAGEREVHHPLAVVVDFAERAARFEDVNHWLALS